MKKGIWAVLTVLILTTVSCSSSRKTDYLYYDDAYYGMGDAKRDYNKQIRTRQNTPVPDVSANDFQSANDPNVFGQNNGQGNTFITNNYYSNQGQTGYNGYSPYNTWGNNSNLFMGFNSWGNNSWNNPWMHGNNWNSGFGNPYYGNPYSGFGGWNNQWNNPYHNPWNNNWGGGGWNNPWNSPWCHNGGGFGNNWGGGFGNNWGGGFGGGWGNNFGGSWAPGISGTWGGRGSVSSTTPTNSFNPHFVAGFMKNKNDNASAQNNNSTSNNNVQGREASKPISTSAVQNAGQGKTKPDYSGRVRSPQDEYSSGKQQISQPDYNRIPTSTVNRPANPGVQNNGKIPVNPSNQPNDGRMNTFQNQQPIQSQPQRVITPSQQPQKQQQQPQRVVSPVQQQAPIQQPQRTVPQNINQGSGKQTPSRGSFSNPSSGGGSFSSPSSGGGRPSGGSSTPASGVGGRR